MKKIKLLGAVFLVLIFTFSGCRNKKVENKEEVKIINGLDFYFREEYNKAIDVFTDILKTNPKDSKILYYRAMTYGKIGQNDSVRVDFERILEADKNFQWKEDHFLSLADYNFSKRKDYPRAIAMFREFLEKFPKSSNIQRVYIQIADSYYNQKDFEEALTSYKKVIEIFGKGKDINDKNAVKIAERMKSFIENNSDFDRKPLSRWSDITNEIDPYAKLEIAKEILAKYPKCNLADEVQFKIAKLYSIEGLNDFDQAVKEYQKLIDLYPKSIYVESAKNSILGIQEKYDPETGKLQGTVH